MAYANFIDNYFYLQNFPKTLPWDTYPESSSDRNMALSRPVDMENVNMCMMSSLHINSHIYKFRKRVKKTASRIDPNKRPVRILGSNYLSQLTSLKKRFSNY